MFVKNSVILSSFVAILTLASCGETRSVNNRSKSGDQDTQVDSEGLRSFKVGNNMVSEMCPTQLDVEKAAKAVAAADDELRTAIKALARKINGHSIGSNTWKWVDEVAEARKLVAGAEESAKYYAKAYFTKAAAYEAAQRAAEKTACKTFVRMGVAAFFWLDVAQIFLEINNTKIYAAEVVTPSARIYENYWSLMRMTEQANACKPWFVKFGESGQCTQCGSCNDIFQSQMTKEFCDKQHVCPSTLASYKQYAEQFAKEYGENEPLYGAYEVPVSEVSSPMQSGSTGSQSGSSGSMQSQ